MLDRNAASTAPAVETAGARVERAFDEGSEAARVFLDGSIVEVFTSAGRSITTRVYPTTAPPWQVEAPDGTLVWDIAPAIFALTDANGAEELLAVS